MLQNHKFMKKKKKEKKNQHNTNFFPYNLCFWAFVGQVLGVFLKYSRFTRTHSSTCWTAQEIHGVVLRETCSSQPFTFSTVLFLLSASHPIINITMTTKISKHTSQQMHHIFFITKEKKSICAAFFFSFSCVNQKVELKTHPAFPVPDSVLGVGHKTESRCHISWLGSVKA